MEEIKVISVDFSIKRKKYSRKKLPKTREVVFLTWAKSAFLAILLREEQRHDCRQQEAYVNNALITIPPAAPPHGDVKYL